MSATLNASSPPYMNKLLKMRKINFLGKNTTIVIFLIYESFWSTIPDADSIFFH